MFVGFIIVVVLVSEMMEVFEVFVGCGFGDVVFRIDVDCIEYVNEMGILELY